MSARRNPLTERQLESKLGEFRLPRDDFVFTDGQRLGLLPVQPLRTFPRRLPPLPCGLVVSVVASFMMVTVASVFAAMIIIMMSVAAAIIAIIPIMGIIRVAASKS